jgi:ABC-type Fe3+-siderophore transport system permease subunit
VARTASTTLELPLGSVTAFVGAPYFLFALRGQEGRT